MADPLCTLMGIADIIAGIIIIVCLNSSTIGIVFGIGMILKGGISFV